MTGRDRRDESMPNSLVPDPPKVTDFVEVAKRSGIEELRQRAADVILVGPSPRMGDDEWSFRTASLNTIRERIGGQEVVIDSGFVVFPLKKVKPGPFASTVLIGRSSSNDVSILHSSVSKLHARAQLRPDGGVVLTDAGSSNGTSINGRALKPDEEAPLSSGDFVLFGACSFVVLDVASFHSVLQRFAAAGR